MTAQAADAHPDRQSAADSNLAAARNLYDALAARDAPALLTAVTPDFHGVVAEGMPAELGGSYPDAQTMLRDCWATVAALVDIRPIPQEYLPTGKARMVVIGRYTGTARATGRPLSAAFAHILRFANSRVSELIQITDTARWHEALAPFRDD